MMITFKGHGGKEKSRKLASVDDLKWCAAVANSQTIKNPFVRNFMQESKRILPNFIRKCPLVGVMSMINFQMPQKLVTMLPVGTYIMKTMMYDEIRTGQTKVEMMMSFSLVDD